MILAAGLGSRLGQLTAERPKALVEVGGKALLERLIIRLKNSGYTSFLVNIHHFADQVIKFLAAHNNFGVHIEISDERNLLLDTGGALLHARSFFSGSNPILVHNVDVITEMDFFQLQDYHQNTKALATLCVRDRETSRKLIFNKQMELIGWRNSLDGSVKWVSVGDNAADGYAYSGIYMVSPQFVNHIRQQGKFSIIDTWLDMATQHRIMAFKDNSNVWFDVGTQERIQKAEAYLSM